MSASNYLYREFESYYLAERCRWAPSNPRRIFNLCFKRVYPTYRDRLSPCEFMSVVYATLGIKNDTPPGMFETFDPAKYRGKLPLADHFANFFKTKLKGKLRRLRLTDAHRYVNPRKFRERPSLGLRREGSKVVGHSRLRTGLACLPEEEQCVIKLTYWTNASSRQIGRRLSMDHKTVRQRHDQAIQKLRLFFDAKPWANAA